MRRSLFPATHFPHFPHSKFTLSESQQPAIYQFQPLTIKLTYSPTRKQPTPTQSIKCYSYKSRPSPPDQPQATNYHNLPLSLLLHEQPPVTEICSSHHLSHIRAIPTEHPRPSNLSPEQQPNHPPTLRKIHNLHQPQPLTIKLPKNTSPPLASPTTTPSLSPNQQTSQKP